MSEAPAATATARSFAANPVFRALRVGLRSSESLPAPWSARLAARVFCTPVPTKLAARHRRAPAGVRVERLAFEEASLTLYRWPAPEDAPRVLLTHGWGGWALQMAPLAEGLARAGFAPIAVDQPAHGRSAGWSSTLAQFARALDYLAAKAGPVQAVVGHSMGGSAALFAASRGLRSAGVVTLGSPASLVQVTRDYAQAFGLAEATRRAMVAHIESREAIVFEQMEPGHVAPRIPQPCLVVHDRDDLTVPVEEAKAWAAGLGNSRLMLTSGLGHRRLLQDPEVVTEVVGFVRELRPPR
jgi:pimeloyl-ACP methyl ester carboxylesterase